MITYFSFNSVPVVFSWKNGTKTIKLLDKVTQQEINEYSLSFGHEKQKTTKSDAKKAIKSFIESNFDKLDLDDFDPDPLESIQLESIEELGNWIK
ncbi:MAG TPA: hypothetical protein DD612_01135 [Methylophilaceae bacterium]|nr:hypothetical protein [Methylophilaceae bacterium]